MKLIKWFKTIFKKERVFSVSDIEPEAISKYSIRRKLEGLKSAMLEEREDEVARLQQILIKSMGQAPETLSKTQKLLNTFNEACYGKRE